MPTKKKIPYSVKVNDDANWIWLDKNYTVGKGDSLVTYRRGVALETQFYPDTVNFPDKFPFWTVKANEEFKTVTEFRFSAE